MKKITLIIPLLFFAACGQDQENTSAKVDISMVHIISEGPMISQPPMIASAYNKVIACVRKNSNGAVYEDAPYIVLVDGPFMCGRSFSPGCTSFTSGTIYYDTNVSDFYNPTSYGLIAHEMIHWVARIGNEGHGTPLFNICENPTSALRQ